MFTCVVYFVLMGSRPLYESQSDRERERRVIDAALPAHVRAVKLPLSYEVDFGLMNHSGRMVGVAEVKVRSKAYDTLMLSLHKARTLRSFAADGLEAWLVVCLPAGVLVRSVEASELLEPSWGGRDDRDDWQDAEPVVHFPVVGMRRVADVPEGVC